MFRQCTKNNMKSKECILFFTLVVVTAIAIPYFFNFATAAIIFSLAAIIVNRFQK